MAAHGATLLELAQTFQVAWLTTERAVDALKLEALCAPSPAKTLSPSSCSRAGISRASGLNDAALQHLHEADQKKKKWEREREGAQQQQLCRQCLLANPEFSGVL